MALWSHAPFADAKPFTAGHQPGMHACAHHEWQLKVLYIFGGSGNIQQGLRYNPMYHVCSTCNPTQPV